MMRSRPTTSGGNMEKKHAVGFLTPWTDQGLGVQCRRYTEILKPHAYTFILAMKPYLDVCPEPSEWEDVADQVFPLGKKQHEINTGNDIIKKLDKVQSLPSIDLITLVIPEPRGNIFTTIAGVKKHHPKTRVILIPNLEYISKSDVRQMGGCDVWCNNQFTHRILAPMLARVPHNPLKIIGFSMPWQGPHNGCPQDDDTLGSIHGGTAARLPRKCDEIRLLAVTGNDAGRRQIPVLIEAMAQLARENGPCGGGGPKVVLTVTSQSENPPCDLPPNVRWYKQNMSGKRLGQLYDMHDVAVVITKYEGLGVSLYEALSRGLPVLTMDANPHKELVLEGINGWKVPVGGYEIIKTSRVPLIEGALAKTHAVLATIKKIVKTNLATVGETTFLDYMGRVRPLYFEREFIQSILGVYDSCHPSLKVAMPFQETLARFCGCMYMINLSRRREKWDRMCEILDGLGIHHSEEDCDCNTATVVRFEGVDLGNEAGVAASQAKLFRKAAFQMDDTNEWVCILEDDLVPHKQFQSLITTAFTKVPSDAKLLYLGAHSSRRVYPVTGVSWMNCGWGNHVFKPHWYGAYAIIVHRDLFERLGLAAQKFFEQGSREGGPHKPLDSAEGELAKIQKEGCAYVMAPCAFEVVLDESDVLDRPDDPTMQSHSKLGVDVSQYDWEI